VVHKLNILGKKVRIFWSKDTSKNPLLRSNAVGLTHKSHAEIYIAVNQSKDQVKDTLLHEVIHVIDRDLELKFDEDQVHRLACGLYQTLKENKNFTRWLIK
jgi:Zn-dependent peptidase ImmA (M78 family)